MAIHVSIVAMDIKGMVLPLVLLALVIANFALMAVHVSIVSIMDIIWMVIPLVLLA